MCIVLAKITELGGRLKCQQGDISWVWYYVCTVVGFLLKPYIHGLVVSAAGSNHIGPSSISGRAEHQSANSSEILKILETNDGRGGRPGCAILSGAKTWECKGSIPSHCLYGQLLLNVSSLAYLLCCIGSGKWNVTRVTLHEFDIRVLLK